MKEAIYSPLRVTESEFSAFILRDENSERHFELIDGEIVEKMVSHPIPSRVTAYLSGLLAVHVVRNKLGRVSSAEGGYKIGTDRVIPDSAFTRQERVSDEVEDGYAVVSPDLAIEVISPSDKNSDIEKKVAIYVNAGIVLWLVNPKKQTVMVYRPNMKPQTLQRGDMLNGGDLLSGFSVSVSEIFDL